LEDSAVLFKNKASLIEGMPTAERVIAAGFSGGAAFLRGHVLYHLSSTSKVDGYLQIAMGPFCWDMTKNTMTDPDSFTFCGDPIDQVSGTKVIQVQSESDPEVFLGEAVCPRDETRLQGPNFRCYEVAGGAHIPKDFVPLFAERANEIIPGIQLRQNPAPTFKPVPSMVQNLFEWFNGITPPPSITLGPLTPTDVSLFFGPVFDIPRDADGNATMGLQLPHTKVPLGEHNGIDSNFPQEILDDPVANGLVANGFFDPFSSEKINQLYPTHREYVKQVETVARNALHNRWILPEDYVDYLMCTKDSVIGSQASYTAEELEAAHCADVVF
jgi:hypothetical protein